MTIKHLVISGGGPILIQVLGALQHLETTHYLAMDQIETMYGTSAGAIACTLMCLRFDWETLSDYIVKRPWQDVFSFKVLQIFEAYQKKGIYNQKVIEKCFKPLFDAKDISMEITLAEFYDMTKIELHMISFEMNEFKVHDISCKTHPSLSLITAIQMSCALPVLMTPVCIEDQCFIDGGLLCNYPLHFCIESGHQPTEILGIKNMCNQYNNTINANSTLIDFLLNILFKAIYSLNTDNAQPSIPHELLCKTECMTLEMLRTAISSHDVRKELYENGAELAKLFLSTCANEVEDIPVPVFLEIIPDELNDGV